MHMRILVWAHELIGLSLVCIAVNSEQDTHADNLHTYTRGHEGISVIPSKQGLASYSLSLDCW